MKFAKEKIISIEELEEEIDVYDIEIADNHNFFANKILAHNCHRFASSKHIKFLTNGKFGFILGLTATLDRSDGREKFLHQYIGPTVYTINNDQAIDYGYIANYELELEKCYMTTAEASQYLSIDSEVSKYMKVFNNNYNSAKDIMQQGPRHHMFKYAVELITKVSERKTFLTKVTSKKETAIKLVLKNTDKKIILFDEIQDSANYIYENLIAQGVPAVLYHSGIGAKQRKEAIEKFKNNEATVLVSVKALDEGLNVKDADLGIIVNGNSQKRQILQRLGRVLRKQEGKVAKLIMLYVPATQDQKYVLERMKYLNPKRKAITSEISEIGD